MDINYVYLSFFLVYLTGILAIGVWGWRQIDTHADFATTSRSLSLPFVTTSLLATYISSLTIIGGVGYASQFGWAWITLFSVGVIAGSSFLSVTAEKWYSMEVNSIFEFATYRYDSTFLRALAATAITFTFVVILIAQLYGIGFILEGVIGVPMPIAILSVGLFITAYTILGGMISVARTDLIQVVVMGVGLLVICGALLYRLFNDPSATFTANPDHMTIYGGETPTNLALFAQFLALGLGTAVHPYFVQRLLSAEDVQTARMAPALTAVGAFLIYVTVAIIGIIGTIYLPGSVGDTMAPAIITNLMGGVLGAIALIALIAVVQSTTDSLLHTIGVFFSQDIYGMYVLEDPSDAELLSWSRRFAGIFGVGCVAIATFQSLSGELTLIAVMASYAWSVIGGSLFVMVFAGMYWSRATREGAIAAVAIGFVVSVSGERLEALPLDPLILAVLVSAVAMVVVSLLTAPPERSVTGATRG